MPLSRPKLTLTTCCGVHILHDGLVDMLYALLPLLREAFGLSYAEVALIRAAQRCTDRCGGGHRLTCHACSASCLRR